jgi:hypothetical protein
MKYFLNVNEFYYICYTYVEIFRIKKVTIKPEILD